MRKLPPVLLLVGSALALAAPAVRAAERHLAVIVDTSGSMSQNDPSRYTLQLAQILSDLVDTGDELHVIRMPGLFGGSCSAGADARLARKLDPAHRASFKRELDALIQYDTGTFFAAPIRTALSVLPRDPVRQRMLLIIADSGGLGECEAELTRELLVLKGTGATVAAINLGGTAGAFDANPAFDFTTPALDAQGLIEAVALVYQKFLGAKQAQTGRVEIEIEVEIAPFVRAAFLAVAADGPIAAVEQGPGNSGAAAVDLNFRGGGQTVGLDGQRRGYRIVHLERPAPGRWSFRVPGLRERAGWMLVQDSSVGVRLVSSPDVPKGTAVPLELELIDQETGRRITDTSKLPGLKITLDVDGQQVVFHDDGQGGDRQAGDGLLTGMATFDRLGEKTLPVRLQSDFLDRTVPLATKVIEAAWKVEVRTARRAEVSRPLALAVELLPVGSLGSLAPPERIDALTGGPVLALRDDGRGGDARAGDRVFSGRWTPIQPGTVSVDYVPVGGSVAPRASAPVEVLGRLAFGSAVPIALGRVSNRSEAAGQLDLGTAEVRGEFEAKVSTPFHLARTALEIDTGEGWVPLGREPRTLRLADGGRRAWPLRLRVGECPEGSSAGSRFEVLIEATGADGRPLRTVVPLTVEVVADPWLRCWWPVIALGAGLAAAAVALHGYWFPSRFPPRLGVVLSPEADLGEGFFHPIRSQRGTRSGFYRDARVYVCQDYRLCGKPRNAVARLRADRKLVRIQPSGGAQLWRQTAEGAWEQLPAGESTARFGDLFNEGPGDPVLRAQECIKSRQHPSSRSSAMIPEFRSGQGTIVPTLFIGLGGVGSRIVDRIAGTRHAATQLGEPAAAADQLRLDRHQRAGPAQAEEHARGQPPQHRGLRQGQGIEHLRRSKDPQAEQWLDHAYQPRPGYKPGRRPDPRRVAAGLLLPLAGDPPAPEGAGGRRACGPASPGASRRRRSTTSISSAPWPAAPARAASCRWPTSSTPCCASRTGSRGWSATCCCRP